LPPSAPDPAGLLGPFYRFLLDHRAAKDAPHARIAGWLASACMGGHHLWQDLGLSERPQVTRLMQLAFPALHDANLLNLRWKRHLFLCLGEALGRVGLRPPKCDDCGDFAVCMGVEAPMTIRVAATITARGEDPAPSQGV
jgi:nitrogen fixation protein NifQ